MAKGKEEKAPGRDERIAALKEMVNKKMRGRAVLRAATDYELPFLYKRLPTGLLSLDLELAGGWPAGGLSQVVGRRNSGKTLLAWWTIRQLQQVLCGEDTKVLLAMTELRADRSQARIAGVQIALSDGELEDMNFRRKEAGEKPLTRKEANTLFPQIGTIDELHALSAEDFYDVLLSAIESNAYHLIVLDSIGNILSNAEQENESVHDKTYGGAASPNTTFLKKMQNLLTMETEWGEVRDTCILAVNQIREDLKDPNKKYKTPGGKALEHAKLVDVYLEPGAFLGKHEEERFTPEGNKKVTVFTGKEVHWSIEKGKAGIHDGARGRLAFNFQTSNFDSYTDTVVAGINCGVIQQTGAWYVIPNPKNPDEPLLKVNGREKFVMALYEDDVAKAKEGKTDTFMNIIRTMAFKVKGIKTEYEWD